MRCLFITDALLEPFDEGFRKFAFYLSKYCQQQNYQVLDLGQSPLKDCFRLLFRRHDILIYLPLSSITFNSLLRGAFLKLIFHAHKAVAIGLQPRGYSPWQKKIFRYFRLGIAVQTSESAAKLQAWGFSRVMQIYSGVDGDRFRAVEDPERIRELRQKYGIPLDEKIILHVGHLKKDRNLMTLAGIQKQLPGVRAVIVTSTSTQAEQEVAGELEKAGALIIRDYLPHIEEIYQLADLYYFPVVSQYDSIEIPLSLIEALACGIPALTLTKRLNQDLTGLFCCVEEEDLPAKVREILDWNFSKTEISTGVARYHWDHVFEDFFTRLKTKGLF
ncbi:MAG: glycosyltransferase [Firmicutes bacterium]|nr:glycosyltransferase [Bacillota bacterium]